MPREEAPMSESNEVATYIRSTRALCPQCLETLSADIVSHEDGTVWMTRSCPEHGIFETYIWPDVDHYKRLYDAAFPMVAPPVTVPQVKRCPESCGICGHHKRRPTLVEIEVTQRCNLRCPVCFMAAEDDDAEMAPAEFEPFFRSIADQAGADVGVQLTGGEPTVRDDLADIIGIGRSMGFWGIEVNTNGLVIARDIGYLQKLVDAGLTGVYLQFDGVTHEPYEHIRGVDILDRKLKAIDNCRQVGIQVVLAMTIVAGVNDDQVGDVVRFALENNDVIAGVALQPAFTSGRFEAHRTTPLTMGDVIFQLETQTDGMIGRDDVWPLGCSHPLCDTGTYLVRHEDSYLPITRGLALSEYRDAYNQLSPQGSVFSDIAVKEGLNPEGGLSIVIMGYMDRATMDLERMEQCSMFCTMKDGRLIPFCSYQLSDCSGKRIHPPLGIAGKE